MKIIKEKIKSKNGMTLIETVVAFAIMAVVAVVVVIGFRTMGNVLNESSKMSRLDQELQRKIATSEQISSSSDATLKITDDIKIKGAIKEYELTEDGKTQKFRVFVAE